MGKLLAKEEVETPEAAAAAEPRGKSGVSFPPSKGETESEPVASFPPKDEPEPVVSFPPAQGEPVVSFPPVQGEPVVSFPPHQVEVEPEPEPEPVVGSFTPNIAAVGQTPQFIGSPWTTGLFDFHEDPTNAVMAFIVPCVTFGQIAEVLDAGELTCPLGSFIYLLMMPALCSQWVMGSKYRTRLRNRYGLVEAPYQDVVSHMFCPCCSLFQEFIELKKRGLDPALGWNGIIAQEQALQYGNHHPMNTPPPAQTMMW